MTGIDDQAILSAAFAPALTLVTDPPADLPPAWQPVLTAPTAEQRATAALTLWNPDLADLLPGFTAALRSRLLDVRLGRTGDDLALVYVVRGRAGELVIWMGWDPRQFREPRFWDRFPPPVQTFLQTVHAGFSHPDGVSGGLAHTGEMQTFAAYAEEPDGFEEWDDEQDIASTRLLVFTSNGTNLLYCVSPDLPAGTLAMIYEGDLDPQPFSTRLDELMLRPLQD